MNLTGHATTELRTALDENDNTTLQTGLRTLEVTVGIKSLDGELSHAVMCVAKPIPTSVCVPEDKLGLSPRTGPTQTAVDTRHTMARLEMSLDLACLSALRVLNAIFSAGYRLEHV